MKTSAIPASKRSEVVPDEILNKPKEQGETIKDIIKQATIVAKKQATKLAKQLEKQYTKTRGKLKSELIVSTPTLVEDDIEIKL